MVERVRENAVSEQQTSSHLKTGERSEGLFDPGHGEAERRGCAQGELEFGEACR